jgi:hypothetical protein
MRRAAIRMVIGAALALAYGCDCGKLTTSGTPVAVIVGSGILASESRPVSGFTALTVTAPFWVIVQQGAAEALEVSADDNVLPLVRSEVRGGRLFLDLGPHASLTHTHAIVCRVTIAEPYELEASAAARLEASGIDAARLRVTLSGAVNGTASGNVGELTLDLAGASRWRSGELRGRAVVAHVSGASHGLVRASESLVADVSGASLLEYLGDPTVVPTVSGASVLRRVGP